MRGLSAGNGAQPRVYGARGEACLDRYAKGLKHARFSVAKCGVVGCVNVLPGLVQARAIGSRVWTGNSRECLVRCLRKTHLPKHNWVKGIGRVVQGFGQRWVNANQPFAHPSEVNIDLTCWLNASPTFSTVRMRSVPLDTATKPSGHWSDAKPVNEK